MSDTNRIAPGALAAWISLALAVSVQGGAAIWWAGVQNTRLTGLEERVEDLQATSPVYHRQIVEADLRIAVIDERIANILARLEALTASLERLHQTR